MGLPPLLQELFADAKVGGLWWEACVLLLSFGMGWLVQRNARREHAAEPAARFGLVLPLVASLGVFLGQSILSASERVPLLKLSLAVLLAWLFARLIGRLITSNFPDSPLALWASRILRWGGWLVAVLVVSDWMGLLTSYLDSLTLPIGKHQTSVLSLVEGAAAALVTVLGALWLSQALEGRLMKAQLLEMSLRLVLAKVLRGVLLTLGLLLALSLAGIDLTVLSVFGGALGVGLGLGLQRLAANYVSGFVILLERSIKVGDNLRVDGFDGQVTAIRTRYTLLQAPNGRESIVPNETLTSSRVENLSLASSHVALSTVVCVGADSDVARVQSVLQSAAASCPRVLPDPAPNAMLSNFVADGLEFTLSFWIADPQLGQLNARSDVNIAVLAGLRRAQIEIPYPQRVVHARKPSEPLLPNPG